MPAVRLIRDQEWRDGTGPRVAFAADGRAFATASALRMHLFEDGALVATAHSPGGLLGELAFGPGDRTILVAPLSYDRDARAWEELPPCTPALLDGLPEEGADGFEMHAGAWAADGRSLALYAEHRPPRGLGAGDGYRGPEARLAVLDGRTGAREAVLWEGSPAEAHDAIAIGDAFVAAGGSVIDVWERPTGTPVAMLEGLGASARALRLSGDGQRLAAGAADGSVAVWDTATWRPVRCWSAHDREATGLAFYPGGHTLATGGEDGAVRLWDGDGMAIGEAAVDAAAQGLAFHPDGGSLLVSQAGPDAALVSFLLEG